jgi:hypothetical protein
LVKPTASVRSLMSKELKERLLTGLPLDDNTAGQGE